MCDCLAGPFKSKPSSHTMNRHSSKSFHNAGSCPGWTDLVSETEALRIHATKQADVHAVGAPDTQEACKILHPFTTLAEGSPVLRIRLFEGFGRSLTHSYVAAYEPKKKGKCYYPQSPPELIPPHPGQSVCRIRE